LLFWKLSIFIGIGRLRLRYSASLGFVYALNLMVLEVPLTKLFIESVSVPKKNVSHSLF
jgi:hypothetical protein